MRLQSKYRYRKDIVWKVVLPFVEGYLQAGLENKIEPVKKRPRHTCVINIHYKCLVYACVFFQDNHPTINQALATSPQKFHNVIICQITQNPLDPNNRILFRWWFPILQFRSEKPAFVRIVPYILRRCKQKAFGWLHQVTSITKIEQQSLGNSAYASSTFACNRRTACLGQLDLFQKLSGTICCSQFVSCRMTIIVRLDKECTYLDQYRKSNQSHLGRLRW